MVEWVEGNREVTRYNKIISRKSLGVPSNLIWVLGDFDKIFRIWRTYTKVWLPVREVPDMPR